jgi:RNA recognition motif-containing protein
VQQVIVFYFCAAMSRGSSSATATVLVSGLPPNSTEDLLLPFFLQFGNVTCIRFKYNRETGACLGYGFVTYSSAEEAAAVLAAEKTEGREFSVALAENGR